MGTKGVTRKLKKIGKKGEPSGLTLQGYEDVMKAGDSATPVLVSPDSIVNHQDPNVDIEAMTHRKDPSTKKPPPLKKEAAKKAPKGGPPMGSVLPREGLVDRGPFARGGFAAIHLGYDKKLMRHVAMKVLHERDATAAKDRLRFLEEGQITAQLDHPNIVPVYEVEVDPEGKVYFLMKLVQGDTLTNIFKRTDPKKRGQRELDEILQILLKVCDGLSLAHERGVVHRDLKPDNIMVGSHGQVYVMDWGIAQMMDQDRAAGILGDEVRVQSDAKKRRDTSGTIIGTPAFMAPEQAWGQIDKIDNRTDVFGVGAMLYLGLTGHAPYIGKTAQEKLKAAQKGNIDFPQELYPKRNLPPGLCRIAMKAMEKDKANRYPTIEALKADIERFLRGGFWFNSKSFKKGEIIIKEGDVGDAAYIITRGTAEAYKKQKSRRRILRKMGPSDVFGETAILTGEPRSASVVAATDLTVMVVTADSLKAEFADDSWMGSLVRALAERFKEQDQNLSRTSVDAEDAKVLAFIMKAIAFNGIAEDGVLKIKWKPLLADLQKASNLPEADVLNSIERFSDVKLDKKKEFLWVKQ
jgi:serine/threonine-protein kinase